MNRNFGIGILILCFGTSGVNAALAAQIVDSSPIIVQPYDEDYHEVSRQMLEQDRINRARITAESLGVSKYHDLIALTEDADTMTVHQDLESKGGWLAERYQMLTKLKDEMTALNNRLEGKGYKEMVRQQQDKIHKLAQRLTETDQRIAQSNESLRWLKQVLAAAKNKAEYYQLTSQLGQITMQQIQREVRDAKAQLQDKENQITAMKTQIQSAQKAQAQADTLRQQLVDQQNKVDLLKQELESKITQSNKMTLLMEDYQKKLESKDNTTNEQLRQLLFFKNYQARMEAQIADLNARLQEKEAQIIKIKKDMYDLQELARVKDRDLQAQDLNLSMIQQKTIDEKINEYQGKINGLQATNDKKTQETRSLRAELALIREQIKGMPSSDEIDFLKTGLSRAAAQLKQKNAMLASIKANADQYEKELQAQSKEFQSIKEQLQNVYEEINRKNEDLKYKGMTIIRLKERLAIQGRPAQLDQLNALPKGDRLREKLKQALDKIDEQGRKINTLVQKLQECAQRADLTRQ